MKRLILSALLVSFSNTVFSLQIVPEELEGDEKTACEVILCLATSKRPSECNRPLAEYFGIKVFTKGVYDPVKTIKKRRNFLEICPTKSNDKKLASLLDAESEQDLECSPNELNKRVETKSVKWGSYKDGGVDYFYRTNPQMPSYCKILFDHEYSFYSKVPVYTCESRWYSEKSWKSGKYKDEISYKKYKELKAQGKNVTREGGGYYQIGTVEKKCWEWSN